MSLMHRCLTELLFNPKEPGIQTVISICIVEHADGVSSLECSSKV